MKPYEHQLELAKLTLGVLQMNGMAYLAAEERTGKTLAAILAADDFSSRVLDVLVVTKRKALEGWEETLNAYKAKNKYTVSTYALAKNHNKKWDLIILDEAHNYISSFPKPGAIWKELRPICKATPIIYISATPHPQGYQQLYHQFALCSYSPWKKHSTFYKWFQMYGHVYQIEIQGRKANQYDRCDIPMVKATSDHLFVTRTRAELGFEHEPEDQVHWVELDDNTKYVYNELIEHNIVELKAGMLVCDTQTKLRFALHMLEGGVAKLDEMYVVLANDEKIRYIKEHFGDTEELVIMFNYKAEKTKLERAFKKAKILQATSYAEGVDLSMHEYLVIYSQDFSTGRHTQRRARQANKNRKTPITVHYLLVKGGLSHQVYKTVSKNKRNFVDSVFERNKL